MYTPDILNTPDDELICYCSGMSKGRILEVMVAGVKTLTDIKALTEACSVGHCRELGPRGQVMLPGNQGPPRRGGRGPGRR